MRPRERRWARQGVASVALACVVVLVAVGSAPAAFSGRNGLIVFSSSAAENVTPQLFSITPSGSGRRNLTRNLFWNVDGSWSPDGRRIAFLRYSLTQSEGTGLFVMTADGSRSRRVAVGSRPAWSPDGSLIAYVGRSANGNPQMHVVRPDGQGDRAFERYLSGSGTTGPAWAPDGRRLAAVTEGARLAIFDLADGAVRDITEGDASVNSSPMWSPDGRTIAYATAGGEIRLIRPDGSGQRVVARGTRAVWSPDGTRLAVVGREGENKTLTVVGSDGTGAVILSHRLHDFASWSPDGRRVAFVESWPIQLALGDLDPVEETATDVFLANADGSGRRRVTHEAAGSEVKQPAWSPDGKRILYSASYDFSDLELYAVGPHGGHTRALTRNTLDDFDPAWSPDGRRLVFARAPMEYDRPPRENESGRGGIIVSDASARHQRAVTPVGGTYASPAWSPDGKWIAFARSFRAQQGSYVSYVYVMHADGSALRRLARGAAPAWSPNGLNIAMTDGYTLMVVRADGSHARSIVSYARVLGFLNAPIGTGLASPAWSPDGKQIAFTAGTSDDAERPLRDFTSALTIRPDGRGLRLRRGPIEDLFTIDWSPDGKKFLLCGRQLLVRPVSGGAAMDLTPGLSSRCNIATWQPR